MSRRQKCKSCFVTDKNNRCGGLSALENRKKNLSHMGHMSRIELAATAEKLFGEGCERVKFAPNNEAKGPLDSLHFHKKRKIRVRCTF